MAMLTKFIESHDSDIKYENLANVSLDNKGKPKESWMKNWTQEQRTEKFFEFCRAYDQREDSLLKNNYQQFSHRLHWDECPFVYLISKINDPKLILNACLLFSFTNEHWQTFQTWYDHGPNGLRERFKNNRACRSDLFQIYYPKGTIVTDWLVKIPSIAANDLKDTLVSLKRPYSMMEYAKILNKYFIEVHGFTNAMYPCKNAARHIAMTHPELVDPESFLHGGTGFFDGLMQVMNCQNFMAKADYIINDDGLYIPTNSHGKQFINHMDYLSQHPSNPMIRQKYLNVEDKLCFFYKHIAISNGIKQTTKQIPYDWVYPKNWSLKTGKYDVT